MKVRLDDSELSLIPDSEEDCELLNRFISGIEKDIAMVSMDGVDLDQLVVQPWCDAGASHCQMCGRRYE